MRLGLAGGPAHPLAKALVLGSRGVAGIISDQLEAHGYETRLLDAPMPSPSDPNAPAEIKRLLMRFLQAAGVPSGRYAHCLHPGVGQWAERPELIQVAQDLGLAVLA